MRAALCFAMLLQCKCSRSSGGGIMKTNIRYTDVIYLATSNSEKRVNFDMGLFSPYANKSSYFTGYNPSPRYLPGVAINTGRRRSYFFDGAYLSRGATKEDAQQRSFLSAVSSIPHWSFIYNAMLIVLDLTMMLLSFLLVVLLRSDIFIALSNRSIPGQVLGSAGIFVLSWFLVLVCNRMYERHLMGEGYRLYAKILSSACINFVVLCTFAYIFSIHYPHWLVTYTTLIVAVLTVIERWWMRRFLHTRRKLGKNNYPVVIIGSSQGIHEIIKKLHAENGKAVGYEPIAVCPITTTQFNSDDADRQYLSSADFKAENAFESTLPVLSFNSSLPQTAKNLGASTVLITDVLTIDSETMRTLALAVEAINLELALTISVADIASNKIVLRQQTGMPILSASLPQYSWATRFFKRLIDIAGSLIALVPSIMLIAIFGLAIKLEDGGPIFYKQERIGLYGKPFNVLKLRSMRVNADKLDEQVAQQAGVKLGATFKVKDDPRVTRVGKFIRKTSIDEVPQFINVLRGEMSLVGPRPQRQYEVDQYNTLYSTRLLVRPGITGPWQIGGRNNLTPQEAEVLDVGYVESWSIMTDIAILFKTVGVVIHGDGAY